MSSTPQAEPQAPPGKGASGPDTWEGPSQLCTRQRPWCIMGNLTVGKGACLADF